MYIYKITNKINGKEYIGLQTKPVQDSADYYGSGVAIRHAINKYGIENFSKEIIVQNINSREELFDLEKKYIAEFKTFKYGYNLTLGGEGSLGCSPSPLARERGSLSRKEFYKKNTIWNKGVSPSDEVKRKMSEAHKGKTLPIEQRLKIINSSRLYFANHVGIRGGTKASEETKEKMRKAAMHFVSCFDDFNKAFVFISKEEYQANKHRYYRPNSNFCVEWKKKNMPGYSGREKRSLEWSSKLGEAHINKVPCYDMLENKSVGLTKEEYFSNQHLNRYFRHNCKCVKERLLSLKQKGIKDENKQNQTFNSIKGE